jgi:cysteine desulfurase
VPPLAGRSALSADQPAVNTVTRRRTAYLDHAATGPMHPAARAALVETLDVVGNASSLHAPGRRARALVEESRERIAAVLGCRPGDLIFTSGGTEADNLAVLGGFRARHAADPRRRVVLASAVEHHAVLDAVRALAGEGAVVDLLPVDAVGRVRPEVLADALRRHGDAVALAAVMWANNEIGTVMPVAELGAVAAAAGVPLHCDAVQALGQVPVDAAVPGVSSLAFSGHKIGGPHGVGVLVLHRGVAVQPIGFGGGQERQVRSGTLDVPGIVGLAAAVEAVVADREATAARVAALRDELVAAVRAAVPDAVLNGDPDPAGRLPGNAHLSFPGCEGDALLMLLDAAGVACSTGSACSAGVAEPSHVLVALGADEAVARSSLRFSLGRTSTRDDVDALLAVLPGAVDQARAAVAAAARRRAAVGRTIGGVW